MIAAGLILPPQRRAVSARHIIAGAIASRDWQPQHHDDAHARAMRLSGVIMNTPTQIAWFQAYVVAWAGARARAARWRLHMKKPIVPDVEVSLEGVVARTEPLGADLLWVWFDCRMVGETHEFSTARMLYCLPRHDGGDPWILSDESWAPPPLQPA